MAHKINLKDFILLFCFEIGSPISVAQAGIKPMAILSEPPECGCSYEPFWYQNICEEKNSFEDLAWHRSSDLFGMFA